MASPLMSVIFILLFFVQSSAGSLRLDVSPTEISPGLTESLTLNCSFSFAEVFNMSAIISLTVSKSVVNGNQQGQFLDLASLNVYTPDHVTQLSEVNGSVSGHIGDDGESYLSIQWPNADTDQTGDYRCIVRGLNSTGQPTEMSQTSVVTSQPPTLDQLIAKVNQLQGQLMRQENLAKNLSDMNIMLQSQLDRQEILNKNQSDVINTLLTLAKSQSDMISAQQLQLDKQSAIITALELKLNLVVPFYSSSDYLGHYYLLSQEDCTSANVSEKTCEDYGGYLVEIDDESELQFLKGFLDEHTDIDWVLVSGTDEGHQGNWTYTYSQTDLNFTAWDPGFPYDLPSRDCIMMYRWWQWKWKNESCERCGLGLKFMCEIERK